MDAKELFQQFRDLFTVRTVFGDPIEREGVTLVPVAHVWGGGGGGEGEASHHRGQQGGGEGGGGEALPTRGTGWGGGGGGFAHAVGAYVIKDGDVKWQPVVDVNKVILGGQIAGVIIGAEVASIIATLVARHIVKRT